jgi:AraC-like DNA-binding protein
MYQVSKYTNFNAGPATEVKILGRDKNLTVASCKYKEASHSIFFVEEPTFTFVVKGHKYILVNGTEFFLKAGDLLFIPENSVVLTFIPQQKNGFESMNVVISESGLNIVSPNYGSKMEDFERIKNAIIESTYKTIPVSKIAGHCNMSVSTFKRKFGSVFGMPPKTWKRTICLQTAYFHLRTTNSRVSDVVGCLGFDNFPHFSYAFKKQFQFSPSKIAEMKLN